VLGRWSSDAQHGDLFVGAAAATSAFKALLVFAAVLLQSAAFRGLLRGLAGGARRRS
jgi:hypothetical protein